MHIYRYHTGIFSIQVIRKFKYLAGLPNLLPQNDVLWPSRCTILKTISNEIRSQLIAKIL